MQDNYLKKEWVIDYFYKKYLSVFRSISYQYFCKLYWIDLEQHDLMSLSYDAIIISIKNYLKVNNKKKIYLSFLKRTYRFILLDYLKKYMTKKHQILNNAKNLNVQNENLIKNNTNFERKIYDKLLLEKIFGDFFKLTLLEKQLLKYKSQGYKNKEICLLMNITYKKLDNLFQASKKKIKKLS